MYVYDCSHLTERFNLSCEIVANLFFFFFKLSKCLCRLWVLFRAFSKLLRGGGQTLRNSNPRHAISPVRRSKDTNLDTESGRDNSLQLVDASSNQTNDDMVSFTGRNRFHHFAEQCCLSKQMFCSCITNKTSKHLQVTCYDTSVICVTLN